MKILVVSPVPLFPTIAGNRARILNMLEVMRDLGHDLHFCYLDTLSVSGEPVDTKSHTDWFGEGKVTWVHPPKDMFFAWAFARRIWRRALREAGFMAGNIRRLDEWFLPAFSKKLRELQARETFDAVLLEYVFLSKALESFGPETLKILDAHDTFGNRHLHFLKSGISPTWYSTTEEEEVKGFLRADKIIAIQDDEAASFKARLGEHGGRVVSVSHFLPGLTAPLPLTNAKAVGYMASGGPTNVQAIDFFLNKVTPGVLARHPDFKVYIAGPICEKVDDAPYIVKMGYVKDRAEIFEKAPIMINPTLLGTGLNIKVLDALFLGVPVVSTKTGARGFTPSNDNGMIVVADDDSQSFTDAILKLLEDDLGPYKTAAFVHAQKWHNQQVSTLQTTLGKVRA